MNTDYFTLTDIFPALLWLLIIIIIGYGVRNANIDKPHYKYYMWNLYAKLFFSLAFAMVYLLYYGGGDTTAYFDGAVKLNNLFFKSPNMYFEEIIYEPSIQRFKTYYDSRTGFPPGWIYSEPEAFFISKLMSFISFFTLKSYLAMTFIMAFITSLASWKLFELIRSYSMNNEKLLAFGILLLPSVNFWCSGVSKDTVVLIAAMLLIYHAFTVLASHRESGFWNYVIIAICVFIILHVRSFIFIAFVVPFLFSFISKVARFFGGGDFTVIFLRTVIFIGGLLAVGGSLIAQSEEEFLQSNSFVQEAQVIQNDFQSNKTYGDKKYDLGAIEFTPVGLLRVAPIATITGIFRPFIWESFSVTLLMNGLESLLFLYFTFMFIKKDFFKKIKKAQSHEFLIFCTVFVFFIAYMTGLTSMLYGVLVRLRAPLLPFLFVLLTVDWSTIQAQEKKKKKRRSASTLHLIQPDK